MSARQRLPNRRACETLSFVVNGLAYVLTYSRFANNNRIAEIFLQNHKPGSQSDANARDAAVAASLALQHGCPLSVLRGAVLRDSQNRPSTPLGCALDLIFSLEVAE
jgi:ribonucleoside-diphosphate reductase alpha chain